MGMTGWWVRQRTDPWFQGTSNANGHGQRSLGDSQGDGDSGLPLTPLPPAAPTAHLTIHPAPPTLPAESFMVGPDMLPSPPLPFSLPLARGPCGLQAQRMGRLVQAGWASLRASAQFPGADVTHDSNLSGFKQDSSIILQLGRSKVRNRSQMGSNQGMCTIQKL